MDRLKYRSHAWGGSGYPPRSAGTLPHGLPPPVGKTAGAAALGGGTPWAYFCCTRTCFKSSAAEILYILVVLARLELNSEDHF